MAVKGDSARSREWRICVGYSGIIFLRKRKNYRGSNERRMRISDLYLPYQQQAWE